ncbi:DC-STAMP domain-containing protein 2 isoform X3 [Pelodiscus sinensis]|uniref:DC-STAMP domain-containing protein 2 isoform X3 n=1 Tax=Pelodiscus sinensis TaxID=13735 RepID=UPI003F6D993E
MGLLSAIGRALRPSAQGPRPRRRKSRGGPGPAGASLVRGVMRSAGGFALGMALASLYGALVLFAQSYSIWYCLVSTATLGAGLGLGMAFSRKVRVTVLLMLPHVFSKEGKNMLLLLALGMAMEGPCANILLNFTRAAQSVSCGAELALNQTAEQLQRAKEPLLHALSRIKAIAQKAKVVGDRVRKFFRAVMDSVRHVARALRNVWYWLVHVGDVCNEELGAPFHKCLRLFDTAKDECERVIPALFFLCYVLLLFKPLCGLAGVLLVFCVIPQYLQPFLRKRVAAPILRALNRVRREFEFNISAVHQFDIDLNASKSLAQVALDIMEDVGLRLQPAWEVLGFFAHLSSVAILYLYLQALRYRSRYLHQDEFDNIYITGRFVALDVLRARQDKPTVLPLSARESTKYLSPGLMYGVCFFIAVFGSYVGRLRRVVCAAYYPSREQERTCFLYNSILTRRTGLVRSLLRATRQRAADGGHRNLLLILAAKFPRCAWLARKMGAHQQYCMGCGCLGGGAASQDFIACITPGCRGLYCQECYQLLNDVCSICMAPLAYQGDMDEEIDSSDEEAVGLWLGAVRALRGQEQERRRQLRQQLRQRILQAVQGQGSCRRLPRELRAWVRAQLEEDRSGDSTRPGTPSPGAATDASSSDLDYSYLDQPQGGEGEGGAGPAPCPPEPGEVQASPDPCQ